MNYDLLFLDFDGTIKQEPNGISAVNKEAILRALRAGKKIFIASGRNKSMILKRVKELKLDDYGDSYSIVLNGAQVIENRTGRALTSIPIALELTRRLFEAACRYGVSCHVNTDNYIYFNYRDAGYEWYEQDGCSCRLADINREDLGLAEAPIKFILITKEYDKLEKIKEEVKDLCTGKVNIEYSSKSALEFTSIRASKGLGLKYICNLLGKPLSSAIAAGDGENDISMIKMAGLGIAMKNAMEPLKEAADVVTRKTCLEDGVSEIIDNFLLA